MSTLPRHQTKTELALHLVRERIRRGDLAPGERLRIEALTQELGMSPTPIREALRLLQADGLIEFRPHQGIVVAASSPERTTEIYRLRAALEPLAVELAVPAIDADELARLQAVQREIDDAAAAGNGTAVGASNAAWHWAIYDRCGSQLLLEFVRRLWEQFPWRTMWVLPGVTERSRREHEGVMAAIRDGDAAGAARLMEEHIETGRDALLEQLAREQEAGDDA